MIIIKLAESPTESRYVAVCKGDLWYVMIESPTGKYSHLAGDDPRYCRLPNYSAAKKAIEELEKTK